ncbi:protein kinase [Nocardia sp. CA2R105]|uniref:protein kinase domain-containing protein n=1 Tax=Nocardia coffeae TaxID=2873381 RepID=UPI001CA7AFBE|nr:protein kinase [Nocardia coffeae]MBY8858243.1 protein kinase [Nocardia coffeae]
MPASVTLSVIKGPSTGAKFTFSEKAHCVVGRADDCHPRIAEDGHRPLVSRHHCLFDINPPDVRVRDFGSLNGTHVNGVEVGRRLPGQTPEEGALLVFRERDLVDGDEIRLGGTVIRVDVVVPPSCRGCGVEVARDTDVCDRCRVTQVRGREVSRCTLCGRELPGRRPGKLVCDTCRHDPREMALALVRNAAAGREDLIAIRGYEPVRELGRGGQGVVYLVHHVDSGEARALKVLPAQVAVDPKAEQSFLREMDIVRGLNHPNIVAFREGGVSGAMFYFVCEYCDGGSVEQLVQRNGPLGVDDAVRITLRALEGLDYAHHVPVDWATIDAGPAAIGVVHRDIKPANILLTGPASAPEAKLADFGLAKAFDRAGLSGHTMTGSSAGTMAFMARPQLTDYKFAKPEVDVWAIAATLYYMLTGQTPREFPRGSDPIAVVLRDDAIPIRSRNPEIPKRLATIIDEALIDRPNIRIVSANELRQALLNAL